MGLGMAIKRESDPYNGRVMRALELLAAASAVGLTATAVLAQTPQPFPRPGATSQAPTSVGQPAPASTTAAPAQADPAAPTEATLGVPTYPAAQFIASYDAGRAQRYYLFGTTAAYADVVAFYKSGLKERGDQIFTQPATHMFEVGRFREETMAFPPGVTVKDWASSGSGGYPNPRPGSTPARFATIIMIVPPPPAAAR